MTVNLQVKIKTGKRTPVEVMVTNTSVNEKIMTFLNGKTMSEYTFSQYLEKDLLEKFQAFGSKEHK